MFRHMRREDVVDESFVLMTHFSDLELEKGEKILSLGPLSSGSRPLRADRCYLERLLGVYRIQRSEVYERS